MSKRYNPPPNWPAPPAGWSPPDGWQPDPSWGPPPPGWEVWVDDKAKSSRKRSLTGCLVIGVMLLLILGVIGALVGGDEDDAATPADTASTPSPKKSGSNTPKATMPGTETSDSPSTEVTVSPSASKRSGLPAEIVAGASEVCRAGEVYGIVRVRFIDEGPSASVAAELEPLNKSLVRLQKDLRSVKKTAASRLLSAALDQYLLANQGYKVLYEDGETAYQAEKAAGRDGDALVDAAEGSWMASLANGPSAPSEFERSC